jgi:hypothetical protein
MRVISGHQKLAFFLFVRCLSTVYISTSRGDSGHCGENLTVLHLFCRSCTQKDTWNYERSRSYSRKCGKPLTGNNLYFDLCSACSFLNEMQIFSYFLSEANKWLNSSCPISFSQSQTSPYTVDFTTLFSLGVTGCYNFFPALLFFTN